MMRKNNTLVIAIETEEIALRIFRVDLSWTIFGIVFDKSHKNDSRYAVQSKHSNSPQFQRFTKTWTIFIAVCFSAVLI